MKKITKIASFNFVSNRMALVSSEDEHNDAKYVDIVL
jgi:hypothetical protein